MLAPNQPTAADLFRPRTTIDSEGAVEGYASLFGELDQARDVVMPGAFRETLRLRGLRRIPMLFQHDPAQPIGIWLELREDSRGLFARGRLIPEVARAKELLALVKAGAIDGLSIGFRTVKGRVDRLAGYDEIMHVFEDFRQANDERLAALERHGGDVVTEEKVDRINAELSRRIDELSLKQARPAFAREDKSVQTHVCKRMRTNAHLAIRHDAYRFMPPGSPRYVGKDVVNYFWPEQKSAQPAETGDVDQRRDLASELKALLRLRSKLAAIKFELRLQRLLRDSKAYNPNQPRVPAGNPDGGRWAGEGGATSAPKLVRLAGPLPSNDRPEIPKQRPPTVQERNRIGRGIARWGGPIGTLLQAIPCLQENAERVDAYRDPPKILEELQQGVSEPKRGYDIHHILEQTSAEQDGFPRSQIDAPENLVRVPTYKHWDITAWYQTKNEDYEGLSPRDYLRGKSWDERRMVGLKALIDAQVLKP